MINVTKPFLPPIGEYLGELRESWEQSTLTNMGPAATKLESELQRFVEPNKLSLTANGTQALELIFRTLKLQPGEVITTPFSFVATSSTILNAGLRPRFVDIEPNYFNIDPTEVRKAINQQTRAILAVHVFGTPCFPFELQEIADEFNIPLIFDAAHAFGVQVNGAGIGAFGDYSAFSFHATKLFSTGEGGAVVSRIQNVDSIKMLRNFGIQDEFTVAELGTYA